MTYYSEFAILHGYFLKCENGIKSKVVRSASDNSISNKPYKLIYLQVCDRTHPSKHIRSILVDEKFFKYVEPLKNGLYCYFLVGYSDNFGKKVFLDIAFNAEEIKFKYDKYVNHVFISEDRRIESNLSYLAYQQQLQDEYRQAFNQFNDTFLNVDSGVVLDDDIPF